MAFVDEVKIEAYAGKGGDGVIRWLRTKETARGGPSGGDGGRGGDIILKGVRDLEALAQYRYEKNFRAEAGNAGENQNKHGKDGEPKFLQVPVGTVARIVETGEEFEITEHDQEVVVFKGGRGGMGNANFKSSTNQNPFKATLGKPGQGGDIFLTLKIIADAGLVGLPNAGKSSLLNALTRAKSKVGNYAFTTLEPNLGDYFGYIIADIPGLIEGASAGRGLGVKFLKHIERTNIIVHLVSAEQEDPLAAYREVRGELEAFGHELGKKQELVVLSKVDLVEPEVARGKATALGKAIGKEVLSVSINDPGSLKDFADRLTKELSAD